MKIFLDDNFLAGRRGGADCVKPQSELYTSGDSSSGGGLTLADVFAGLFRDDDSLPAAGQQKRRWDGQVAVHEH